MIDQWQGCYDDGWQGDIVPEAFTHPAKFSRGLIHRIYRHAKEMGWIKPGDCVLDPFGGVALGGLDAISMGLNWIGIELEKKFVDLGWQNINKWYEDLRGWPNLGTARLINGDSRKLKYVIEGVDLVLSSPPYAEIAQTGGTKGPKKYNTGLTRGERCFDKYGNAPGNLANLPEGKFDAVISSPPWEKNEPCQDDNFKLNDGRKVPPQGQGGYGNGYNQIGNSSGNAFWSASLEIVQQCYNVLKLGGHAIWVTKDYVKAKKIVPFSDRWLKLNESVGFKLICRHQGMLIKDHGTQITINGEEKITTERKSFFRRLAESKGSPRIDWEDILCFEKSS